MLKLRPEKFGGLVFNTKNGVRLSLDQAGFFTFEKFIKRTKAVRTETERNFLQDVCQKLNLSLSQGEFYLINHQALNEERKYPFSVLAAPVLVDFQITKQCNLSCPHCYAESSSAPLHTCWSDIIKVFDDCAQAGVFEVALGGGEPTLHPQFVNILKAAKKRNLVCNLATNGKGLNNKLVNAFANYCGAIALSLEFLGKDFERRRGFKFEDFLKSVERLKKANIKLIFQITVSQSNLYKICGLAEFLSKYQPYGIVFLTYKPVGRGKNFDSPLINLDSSKILEELKKSFRILEGKAIKIGYDCCLANLVAGLNSEVVGCSATRESVAVNLDLDVLPCSFVSNYRLGNLKNNDLLSIWQGDNAKLFRDRFVTKIESDKKCHTCRHKLTCLGGCPEFNLVECIF